MSRKDRTVAVRAVRFRRSAIARRSAILSITLPLLTLAVSVTGAHAASDETIDDTFPASVNSSGAYANESTGGASTGGAPSISADGRYVAFISDAQNLDEQDPPTPAGVQEAYVKDLHTGEVKLVSRANGLEGEPANEPGEGIGVEDPSISGNGRYVIFTSAASNLVSGLPPAAPEEHPLHVYRRDLQTGETTLVDRVTGAQGAILGERGARAEAISADGRYVLFRDGVEDLEDVVSSHEPGLNTVYVRDIQAGTTTAVSRADGASGELANEPSRGTSISPEGRYVAFESAATNLVAGMQSNTVRQVYLRDLQTDTTTLASATPAGEPANGPSEEPLLLSGGCQVAFSSQATNLYLYEAAPVLTPEVYLADLCSTPDSVTLVSRANGQDGAPAAEGNAVIPTPLGASSDGSYILFSAFSELTGEASHEREHLYLRDLNTGQTTLVDRQSGAAGEPAQGNPEGAALSANGCRVAFATQASNLGEPLRLETYVRNLAPCNEEPTVTPTTLSFGAQPLDTVSAAQQITLTAGSETLQIHHLRLDGADPSDFIVTANECSGETLEPGETCTFMVRFLPSASGQRSATLSVQTDPAVILELGLSGEGSQLSSGAQGPAGAQGANGQQGSPGSQGPAGLQGPTGATGKTGARGPAGRDAQVTCHLTNHRRIVTCQVRIDGKKAGSGTQALLMRKGHTYARGPLGALRVTRSIRYGTYTLRLDIDGSQISRKVPLA
jgi:Collagen triple helix repeat (20 copies)/WD40-like Beta Propeller Repeat